MNFPIYRVRDVIRNPKETLAQPASCRALTGLNVRANMPQHVLS
jgi:hypothetical protein